VVEKGADSGLWAVSNTITGIVNRKENGGDERLGETIFDFVSVL
jgi:hypothetical protein